MESAKQQEILFLFSILVLTLLIQLPLLNAWPLITDENLYAIMISEQMEEKTILPTFLGYPTTWKPPLFFWVYADMVNIIKDISMPVEALFRLPTVFFGILSLYVLYYLLKELEVTQSLRFLTVLIYILVPVVIYTNNSVLVDTMANFFILLALFFYVKKDLPYSRFLLGGFFVALAFFTKLLLAAMVPILAIAYFFIKDKKVLTHPLFLLSILALPLSIGIHFWILDNSNFELLYGNMMGNFTYNDFSALSFVETFVHSSHHMIFVLGFWLFLSLAGLWKHWKDNKFMAFWYILLILPLLSAGYRPWYFLPIVVPIAYFSVMALGKIKRNKLVVDNFMIFGFLLFLLFNIFMMQLFFWSAYSGYIEEKMVGEFLVGKENVLIFGDYRIGMLGYKILNEKQEFGQYNDFGWVIFSISFNESVKDYIEDYDRPDPRINDESINRIYLKDEIFRKKTDISEFDYVLVVGEYEGLEELGEVLYHSTTADVLWNRDSASVWVIKLKD